jgi:hypothetical protein
MTRPALRRQHGAVTLAITLALLMAMLITLWAANRNLLLEWRQSVNQAHAAAAFEAAEAGLDWATAMLNDSARTGSDCRPSPLSTQSFREQYLDVSSADFAPRPLRPACTRAATGWSCTCAGTEAAPPAGGDTSFGLRFSAGPSPGQLRVSASGSQRDASAQHSALVELQPALPHPPATALSVRAPAESTDSFFVRHFGLSKAQWLRQPAVHQLACDGDCGAALAVLANQGVTLVALPGDVLLRGPLVLGTPERPMLMVAGGQVQLQGAVRLHGVIHAAGLGWTAPAATVRGALLSEGAAAGDASLDLARDAAVLEALQTRYGSFVRLPGSWRDF